MGLGRHRGVPRSCSPLDGGGRTARFVNSVSKPEACHIGQQYAARWQAEQTETWWWRSHRRVDARYVEAAFDTSVRVSPTDRLGTMGDPPPSSQSDHITPWRLRYGR